MAADLKISDDLSGFVSRTSTFTRGFSSETLALHAEAMGLPRSSSLKKKLQPKSRAETVRSSKIVTRMPANTMFLTIWCALSEGASKTALSRAYLNANAIQTQDQNRGG